MHALKFHHVLSVASPFVAALSLLAARPAQASGLAFGFTTGTGAWNVFSISALGAPLADPQSVGSPGFDAANGLPPGSLRAEDLAGETWVGETTTVRGNRASLYGVGAVSYDVLYRYKDAAQYAAVGLYGSTLTIYQPHDEPQLDVWLHWEFPLVAGAWRVGSINGPVATEAQILQVLGDLKGIFIHTEWRTGPDDTSLDNVVLGSCAGAADAAACRADINGDGHVNGADLGLLLGSWGACAQPADCAADLNEDGVVNGADLGVLLGNWG